MPRNSAARVKPKDKRLVIISNRLPISVTRKDGKWTVQPSAGGLVTALGPVLRNRGGLWIGWNGVSEKVRTEHLVDRETKSIGYQLVTVGLTEQEVSDYYYGFSNEIIWPLFHNLQTLCNYNPEYWTAYERVNAKYAEQIAKHTQADDFIWVHDYHLMTVAAKVRKLGHNSPLGFFLHIPFPPPDIFQKMPWREQILRSLLEFDIIGLQTAKHRRNFLNCVRAMLPEVAINSRGPIGVVRMDGREVQVGHFPIGIDFDSFADSAQAQEVTDMVSGLRENLRSRCFVLGVDRLDYTKGIPYKLDAMREALRRFPELHRAITFIQVVVPSRAEIESYSDLKTEIEQMVSEINGEFGEPGWVPIQYIYRSLRRTELLAFYRAADVALVTPLEDGMNLVAKEFCACSVDGNGVLILSEFAGAADQLRRGALLVNPYDQEGVATAIHQAFEMDTSERKSRMRRLRKNVQDQNIFRWVDAFLYTGAAQELQDFPRFDDTFPRSEVDSWFEGG